MNGLYQIKHTIEHYEDEQILTTILNAIIPETMYSYILRKQNGKWKCKFTVCTSIEYNTINKDTAFRKIITVMLCSNANIVYDQPSLDIMIEMYTPLVHRLAHEQKQHWCNLEYEDLVQMCYLSMIKLYRKGYYLNKSLLETVYIRDILLSIRKSRTDYEIVSINDTYGKDESLTVSDTLEDIKFANDRLDEENREEIMYIFNEVKDMIIDQIGERRFEQLFNEYKNRTTTTNGQQTMFRLRRSFAKDNITMNSFRR